MIMDKTQKVMSKASIVADVASGTTTGRSSKVVFVDDTKIIIDKKDSVMKYLKQLLAVVLLCAYGSALAAISSGYYCLKSYNDKYMTENNTEHTLVCSDLASPTNYAQVWYLTVFWTNVTVKTPSHATKFSIGSLILTE